MPRFARGIVRSVAGRISQRRETRRAARRKTLGRELGIVGLDIGHLNRTASLHGSIARMRRRKGEPNLQSLGMEARARRAAVPLEKRSRRLRAQLAGLGAKP